MQEFYDAAGERCAAGVAWLVVTTREPEWDDSSRGRALRLAEYEDGFCKCGCNQPLHIARDPERVFDVDEFTCYAGRALEIVTEQRRAEAEARKQPPLPPGHHLYVRPHDPDRKPIPTRKPRGGGPGAGEVRPGSTPG